MTWLKRHREEEVRPVFAQPKDVEDDYATTLRDREAVVQKIIFVLALISGWWTFEGAYLLNSRIGGDTLATTFSAAVLAIGVTCGCVTAWWVLMTVIPRLSSKRQIIAGCLLVGALQIWMLGVSSLNNVIAQSAQSSILAHLENQLAGIKRNVELAHLRADKTKQFLIPLRGESEGWCLRKDSELEKGVWTGSPGRGAVVGTLESLCAQSQSQVESFGLILAAVESRSSTIKDVLQRMDAVLYEFDLGVFEREREFIRLSSEVEDWLLATKADDLTTSMKFLRDSMSASVSALGTQSGQFGKVQQDAIQSFKLALQESSLVIQEFVEALDETPEPEIIVVNRISLVDAVWRSKVDHLPQITAAVGIDMYQLFMVLTFLIGRQNKNTENTNGPFGHWLTIPGKVPIALAQDSEDATTRAPMQKDVLSGGKYRPVESTTP